MNACPADPRRHVNEPSPRARRAAGALEHEVLAVLWAAEEPMTPTEIQAGLASGLAYNTVHTILTRLQEKSLVVRTRRGTRSAYAPVKDAAQVAAERMRDVLDAGHERDAILQRFVTTLSPEDEAALRAALDAHERP
jgi:predicted transcriptional regulator